MATPGKREIDPVDPDAEDNPGYAERQPRDREDAQRPDRSHEPDPDDGGLGREPEGDPDPASD